MAYVQHLGNQVTKGLNMNKVPKVGDFGFSELPQVTEQINPESALAAEAFHRQAQFTTLWPTHKYVYICLDIHN